MMTMLKHASSISVDCHRSPKKVGLLKVGWLDEKLLEYVWREHGKI
jgi:hypothetical protein